jgi:endo-1,4-beta-xylanase
MFRLFAATLLFLLFAFTEGDEPLCATRKLYEAAPFPVGTALNTGKLKNEERYWTTALEHYNSFTPEKVMKPTFIHPKKDAFDFWEVDQLMRFCRERNIRLHGHTLIWDKANPSWMETFKGDSAEWESMLKQHIQTIVSHCKNDVHSWDVINEAFNDDGSLRQNIWLKNIGSSYIKKAFTWAKEADEQGLLFYNDYSLENNSEKLERVLAFFAALKGEGAPIDGIGMQMHISLERPSTADINSAAKKIEAAGFLVHYSELDISLTEGTPAFTRKKILYERQRIRVKEIVEGYMLIKKAARFGITFWGVSDNDSWLMEEHIRSKPLLFNSRYKPKPAYCGFLEGLQVK